MPLVGAETSAEPHRKRMKRREREGDLRFLTFSWYQRLQLFSSDLIKDRFAAHLSESKARIGFDLFARVVMPEHVHLLLRPPLQIAPLRPSRTN